MRKSIACGLAAALVMAAPALGCDTILAKNVPLSVCVDSTWVADKPQGDQDYIYYSADGNYGFMVLSEQGNVSASDFRTAILNNAKAGADSVDIINERTENVADRPWNVIEFKAKTQGTDLDMTNYYYIAPGFGAVQLVVWTSPQLATSAAFRAGEMFSTVKFTN